MKTGKSMPFLVLFICPLYSATIDTVNIKSEAMDSKPQAIVVIPDSCVINGNSSPALYLLHGWSGCYRDWPSNINLGPLADQYEMIIVCPDGGYASWYLDSPLIDSSQYETYIAVEVVDYIDQHYPTIEAAEGRFLCGLSMGGHGALSLLAKHPDRFSAAGSMSGVMELKASTKRYGIAGLIGSYESNPDSWRKNSCTDLVRKLINLDKGILIDCGIDDFTIESNRKIHNTLLNLEIPHVYIERPGEHTWDYWKNALEYHLLFFKKRCTQSR